MSLKFKSTLLALALTSPLTLTATAHASDYEFRALDHQVAASINDAGEVVAYDPTGSVLLGGPNVLWQDPTVSALHVTEAGELVGWVDVGGDAFAYDGMAMHTFAALGMPSPSWGPEAQMYAQSETGLVVGYSTVDPSPSGVVRTAVTWEPATGTVTTLAAGAWPNAYARDISPNGRFVVGTVYDATFTASAAVLWDLQLGAFVQLTDTVQVGATPYTATTVGYGVNDSGEVVGGIGAYPVRWDAMGQAHNLGNPAPLVFDCHGNAINEQGDIVGDCGNTYRGFVWRPGMGMIQLLDSAVPDASAAGWVLRSGEDINELGQIVGFGMNPSGDVRGFVLSHEDACLRPCDFSGGEQLVLPREQCIDFGGEIPVGAVDACLQEVAQEAIQVGHFVL